MRFFLTSLFALLFISGCSLKTTKGLKSLNSSLTQVENVYFSDESKPYVYRVSMTIYGKNQSGILIIKRNEDGHRLVYTTEFGSKIFDFEFIDTKFKVNLIIDDLNKKIFLKTLEEDFRLLLDQTHQVVNEYNDGKFKIYQNVKPKGFCFLFLSENGNLDKIVSTSTYKENVILFFRDVIKSDDGHLVAKRINIDHQNLKFNLVLTYLKQ